MVRINPLFIAFLITAAFPSEIEVPHHPHSHAHKANHHSIIYKDIYQDYPRTNTGVKEQEEAQNLKNVQYPCKVAHCNTCYSDDFMKCRVCDSLYEMNADKDECYEPSEFVQFAYRLLLSSTISFTFFLIMFLYYYYTKLHKSLTKNLADYIEDVPSS